MRLGVEKWYPSLAGIVSGGVWRYFDMPFPPDEKEFLAAAISIGAILTGFIATAIAILAALPSDSVIGRIRKTGYVKELIRYLQEALYGCMAFSIFGMAGFFFLNGDQKPLAGIYSAGWIGLAVYALLGFQRVASILAKIIKAP